MGRLIRPTACLGVVLIFLSVLGQYCSLARFLQGSTRQVVVPTPSPGPQGVRHNDYRCTSVPTPLQDGYIVQYEPVIDPRLAHHMLLFGCHSPPTVGSWDCKSTAFLCGLGENPQIIFAWALNASGIHMPPNVGLKVGPSVGISFLVIQLHYGSSVKDIPDISTVSKEALIVHTTKQRQRFLAGIYLLGTSGSITAGRNEVYSDAACEFLGPKPIFPFAFRTHAHSLGKQIVGYVIKPGLKWEVIGTRSPQDPQAFYPVTKELQVDPNDWLAARCVFDTKNKHHTVHMGPDSEDEMCNYYLMYYTENDNRKLTKDSCWSSPPRTLHFPAELPPLPVSSSQHHHHGMEPVHSHHMETPPPVVTPPPPAVTPPPPAVTPPPPVVTPPPPAQVSTVPRTVAAATTTTTTIAPVGTLVQSEDWPLNGFPIPAAMLGQVTAVAIDGAGQLHILHRGPVVWDYGSFDVHYKYQHIDDGPIEVATLVMFSAATGKPHQAWGGSLFYMPHGLTIDHKGSFWVTDVAMHQVFKFSSFGDKKPSLVLGQAFKPGGGYNSFCQPTSVAVEKSGVFYVADGYCNSRIMKYNSQGRLAEVWEAPVGNEHMMVPHKAILNAAENILYVADRENRRIVSFSTSDGGRGHVFSDERELGGRPYAIFFNGSKSDWPMYGVFGGVSRKTLVGFTLDERGNKIGTWGPQEGFTRPHDLVVDTVHNAVYITEIGPNKIWKFVIFPSPPRDISNDLEEALNSHQHPTAVHGPTPSSPSNFTQHTPNSTSMVTEGPSNETETNKPIVGNKDALINTYKVTKKTPTAGVNVGVAVAVVAVVALIALVAIGVLKEHRFIKFQGWRLLQAKERDTTIGVKPSGSTTQREEEKERKKKKKKKKKKLSPRNKLQSLLGPSHLGFSRLRTYDSNSEDEEFPVFNRV